MTAQPSSTIIARRWLPLGIVAWLALAACGGPGSADPAGPAGQSDSAGNGGNGGNGGGGDGGGNGGGGGSSDGPITITVDGRSAGYEIGRCDVIDDVVFAQARGGDRTGFANIDLTLPEWDREKAHSRRDGRISAVVAGEDGSVGYELTASYGDPGTTWDWTVSGTQVEVTAVMGNRTTATRESGIEQFVDYHDVTIRMECSGTFGVGLPEEPMHEAFFPIEPPMDRAPGTVTVDLEGESYPITYLTLCQFFSNDVSAEGTSDEAYIYFYSEGRGVNLDFEIGDQREDPLEHWRLLPDASLQSAFAFEGSGTTRSWSGTVVSEAGAEAEATITVECTEGDGFEQAGTGSIVVDGVTSVMDEVVTCTIDGGTVDFFGRQAVGDVALLVTGGGTEILYGDASGQTIIRDIAFDINGQQATWTGTLAGDRQATVAIDCG